VRGAVRLRSLTGMRDEGKTNIYLETSAITSTGGSFSSVRLRSLSEAVRVASASAEVRSH
jgi:hypothetical protein